MSIDVTRARGELAQLWQALLERVLGSLASRSARSSEPEAPALQRLHQLRTFLLPAAAPGPAAGEPAAASAVPSLHELLQYQARLQSPDTAPGASAGAALVRQQVQRGLLVVARLCRHSEWTLDHLLASGLARQARELALLGRFCGDASLAQQLALLEARLILLHAAALAPPAFQLSLLQQQVLALAHGTAHGKTDGKAQGKTHGMAQGHGLAALPCVTQAAVASADSLGLQELEQLQATLHAALLVQEDVSERSMIAVYRLSWVLQALGYQALADCGQLLYQLLVRHWQQRAVLSSPLVVLHQSWLQQVSTAHGATTQDLDTSLLLQLSPALAAAPWRCDDLQPLLQLPRQAPEHMAAMLHVLLQVQPAWFADRASWSVCKAALWQELQLLEQGAAALRLLELETFCSGLLALHAQLELMLPADPWPAHLLWRVHAGLVQMLDRAALWQEPMPPADTVAALQQALLDGEARLQALLREQAGPDARWQLAAALLLFGRQAGRLLGHGVRIRLQADVALPSVMQRALLQSLQEILRWLLLQHEGAVEQLRRLRLPLATDIDIRLAPLPTAGAAEAEEGCDVALQEGGARSLPGSKAQQRLQRCLGPAVEQLQFDHTEPAGRRVTFRLSCASLQRAHLQRYRGETAALQM